MKVIGFEFEECVFKDIIKGYMCVEDKWVDNKDIFFW